MSDSKSLVKALKQLLKQKQFTYKAIGKHLDISESSVKRLLSSNAISLDRIERLCQLADVGFLELAQAALSDQSEKTRFLTLSQEKELADEPKLLAFFYLLTRNWSVEKINEEFNYSEQECQKHLLKLDKIGLIELHPDNRIKLLVSKSIVWRPDGPVFSLYIEQAKAEFFNYDFGEKESSFEFRTYEFSQASKRRIQNKITKLIQDVDEIAEMDGLLPKSELEATGLILGFRPWVFSVFADHGV